MKLLMKLRILQQIKKIREILKNYQKNFYDPELGLVADGRDMGTVIFQKLSGSFFLLHQLKRGQKEGKSS